MNSTNTKFCLIRFLSGPLAAQEFSLKKSSTIGRDQEADIHVHDESLSRIHAEFIYHAQDDSWTICDKGSQNGTWTHGKVITTPTTLENHQRVRLGDSLFEVEFIKELNEAPGLDSQTIHFTPESLAHTSRTECLSTPSEDLRLEHRQLSIIYKVQNAFAKLDSEAAIYHTLFETVFKELAVDDIYLLDYCAEEDDFKISMGQDKHFQAIHIETVPISDEILSYVKTHKDSILVNDPDTVDSTHRKHHVLCSPIVNQNELVGVIYAINFDKDLHFNDHDLTLLSGLAHSSCLSIMNCRLLKQNIINERMASLGTTAASLSHYIKNILTSIDGSMYLMKSGIEDNEPDLSMDAYNILEGNHQRLSGLVMDLLNLAKEDTLEIQPTNLSEIVFEVAELVKENVKSKNIEFSLAEDFFNEPAVLEIDGQAIHRVLLNIINNAIDAIMSRYDGERGGKITVTTELFTEKKILNIYLEDNGCGMTPVELRKIFEMFYSTKDDRGTGLGLAVSKRIIKAHNGLLSTESVKGQFTRFTIKLPLAHDNTRMLD